MGPPSADTKSRLLRSPRKRFAECRPNDEVGALARTLQGMLVRIEVFMDRERQFT